MSRPFAHGLHAKRRLHRGALLLEVLISLGLLVFGMALVGMQINTGLDAAKQADLATRAVMLADSKMAELNAGVVLPESNQQEMMGDFGTLYPGFTWRFEFVTTDVPTFLMVTLKIGYNAQLVEEQLANPSKNIEFEAPNTKTVYTVYRLMPIPADLNLERDFGITQDDIKKALGAVGGSAEGAAGEMAENNTSQPAGGQPGGQAGNGGGLQLPAGMDPSQIMNLLGPLLEGGNFDPRMLSQLPPEILQQIGPYLEMFIGRGGLSSPELQQQLMQQLQGQRGGGPRNNGGERMGSPGKDQGENTGGTGNGPGNPNNNNPGKNPGNSIGQGTRGPGTTGGGRSNPGR